MQDRQALFAERLESFSPVAWEMIPDFGLYMDQVVTLLSGYLDYMPPELKEEQVIAPAAINNYVRKKIMPEPVKKRPGRNRQLWISPPSRSSTGAGVGTRNIPEVPKFPTPIPCSKAVIDAARAAPS